MHVRCGALSITGSGLVLVATLVLANCAKNVATDERQKQRVSGAVSLAARCATSGDPVLQAAATGDLARLTELLDGGADPDQSVGDDKQTALACATEGEQPESLRILLESGANPNLADATGATPLHLALQKKNFPLSFALVDKLLDFGADPNARRADGSTCLHDAVATGNVKLVELLFAAKENVYPEVDRAGGPDGLTPLAQAARDGAREIVVSLLNNFDAVAAYVPPGVIKNAAIEKILRASQTIGTGLSLRFTLGARKLKSYPVTPYTPAGESALQFDFEAEPPQGFLIGVAGNRKFDVKLQELVATRWEYGSSPELIQAANEMLGTLNVLSIPSVNPSGAFHLEPKLQKRLKEQLAKSAHRSGLKARDALIPVGTVTTIQPIWDALRRRDLEAIVSELDKALAAEVGSGATRKAEVKLAVETLFTDLQGQVGLFPFGKSPLRLSGDLFSPPGLALRKSLNQTLLGRQVFESEYAKHCEAAPADCGQATEKTALKNVRLWFSDMYVGHALMDLNTSANSLQVQLTAAAVDLLRLSQELFEESKVTTALLAAVGIGAPLTAEMQAALTANPSTSDRIRREVDLHFADLKKPGSTADSIVDRVTGEIFDELVPSNAHRPGPRFRRAVETLLTTAAAAKP